MNKLSILCGVLLLGVSCTQEKENIPIAQKGIDLNSGNPIIIQTERSPGNLAKAKFSRGELRSTDTENPFHGEEIECSQFSILPNHVQHTFIGNVLEKSSVRTLTYRPAPSKLNPITITADLPQPYIRTITSPSHSAGARFCSDAIKQAEEIPCSSLLLDVKQFVRYSELKAAFGVNVNTSSLFSTTASSSSEEDLMISETTGIYVKFAQTSFSVIMDYPEKGLAPDIPIGDRDKYAYVSSVTYGRMGILALETRLHARDAIRLSKQVFQKFFSSGHKSYSAEEQNFLSNCHFRLYYIGDPEGAVSIFKGFDEFVKHIPQAKFTRKNYGKPIYYTLNSLSDNSVFKSKFRLAISQSPTYVEIVGLNPHFGFHGSTADIELRFYRTKSLIPSIPDPSITFFVTTGKRDPYAGYSEVQHEYKNHDLGFSLRILNSAPLRKDVGAGCREVEENGWDCSPQYIEYSYTLKQSPRGEYIILGDPTISSSNIYNPNLLLSKHSLLIRPK